MNAPLRRLAVACMVMFGLLLANANYVQVVKAGDYRARPGNARVVLDEYDRQRGPILIGGRPVAASRETNGRLRYLRRYSNGPLYAPVTGFYSIVYGATGVERAENGILAGTDDRLFVRRLVDLVTGEAQQGGSVELTINPRAQRAAYAGLRGRSGAVVALEPSTGAILAMANAPSFDPNELSSHDVEAIQRNYRRLLRDDDDPLENRAIARTYPPGSTFKIVTAAAALESGRFRPGTPVPGPASLDLPLTTVDLPNYDGQSCGAGDETTLANALRISCNTAFGGIGLDLGDDALRRQAERFGFNDDVAVPMRSATSVFPADINEPQTAQSAIGQFDVRATPLQMAMVAAGVANNGLVMKPYLVSEVRAPDLSPIDSARTEELSRAVSAQTAAQLRDMMVAVVETGTGTNAQIDGVRVAGKTGTAQRGEGRRPLAWFVSFAPADNPRVAVAVVVEDAGEVSEISGNQLAAPIAQDVMQAVLR